MRIPPFLFLLILFSACAVDESGPRIGEQPTSDSTATENAPTRMPEDAARAYAALQPLNDSDVEGRVDFTTMQDGVRVVALIRGLDDGLFGFHIHEGSSCEQPGGHFNPINTPHGDPTTQTHHPGDLGNIRSARGRARYDRIDAVLQMDSTDSIVGRVVGVHLSQDDLNSQPDGGSGEIAACGIIEAR